MQSSLGQQNIQMQQQPAQYQTPPTQPAQQPVQQVAQPTAQQPIQQQNPQGQNVQVPNYSGVNIQIFNPSVTPPGATSPVYNVNAPNYNPNPGCYPSGYYTGNWGPNGTGPNQTSPTNTENNSKKTEKKEIVQLTDDYIRTIENYLNSQDKEIRLMGAKEVMARLDEDHSRKDDKALTALVNKMLQDPASSIRLIALSAINSRIVAGDQLTYNLLQQLQNSQSGYGQETLEASNALLKMSGQTVEKEFEAKSSKQSDSSKKETKYHLK